MSTTLDVIRRITVLFFTLSLLTICVGLVGISLFLGYAIVCIFVCISVIINHTQENLMGVLCAGVLFFVLVFFRPSFFSEGTSIVLAVLLLAICVLLPGKASFVCRVATMLSATWVLFAFFSNQHPIIFDMLGFAGIGGFIFTGILLVIAVMSIFQARLDITVTAGVIILLKLLVEKLGISLGDIAKNTIVVLIPLAIILICSIAKAKNKKSEVKVTEKTPSKGQG